MTISRKLAFMVVSALGAQFITHPYFDAAALKKELAQVMEAIDIFDKHGTQEAKKAAKWLKKQIDNNQSWSKTSYLDNTDIVAIAKTISTNATIDAKLITVSKKIVECTERQIDRAKDNTKWLKNHAHENMLTGLAAGAIFTIMGVALYSYIARIITWEIEQHDSNLSSNIVEMVFKLLKEQKDQEKIEITQNKATPLSSKKA